MEERGLSGRSAARRVREFLPPGETFSEANISHYRNARSMPRTTYLAALSQALGVDKAELCPSDRGDVADPVTQENRPGRHINADLSAGTLMSIDGTAMCPQGKGDPHLYIEALRDGAMIQVSGVFSWPVAIKILQILKEVE
jgi:hypothetical protein